MAGDGTSRSLRALLDRLDEHALDAAEFSVHTPDLDDVFLALTEHTSTSTDANANADANTDTSTSTSTAATTEEMAQ